ncbi:DUF3105 domain-containing protein [Spirillospora albida]|uniref:DUF3105 domain-containing protein n=1 Tax=Spirillospora albida TaxID=58123 RepID=UPI0004C042FA|nr:DUF3105 domain-containing protein [Spirillospora albida]
MSKGARNRNSNSKARPNALTERQTPWGVIAFYGSIGVLAIVAITYAFILSRPEPAGASIKDLVQKDDLGRDHTSGTVKYDGAPPMGGDHDPMWQNCDARVYEQPLRNENAVHSLEHGAVWITYRPGLDAAQLSALKAKVSATGYTFLSPYPSQKDPITLTAWGSQVGVQSASDTRIDAFLRTFVKGPQTPEPGAACDGAKDAP